jgi:hypothetical protein
MPSWHRLGQLHLVYLCTIVHAVTSGNTAMEAFMPEHVNIIVIHLLYFMVWN